ncbi:MAG: hypothetical protein AB7S48_16480 [Bacteroidales bacterium]
MEIVEKYRDYYFGISTVDSLELAFNDWYQRKECVKELFSFELK